MVDQTLNYGTPASDTVANPDAKEAALQAILDDGEALEKSAATALAEGAPTQEEFENTSVSDRLSEPSAPQHPEDGQDAEETEAYTPPKSDGWGPKPTIKDQVKRFPDSVRTTEHVTKLLNMGDDADMKFFNELQAAAHDPEAPTRVILEKDVQKHKGSWTMLVTYARVEYLIM